MYCGPKCRQVVDSRRHYRRNNPPKSETELQRICVTCSTRFTAHYSHPNALTCSVKCNEARMNAERRRAVAERYDAIPQKECAECKTVFTVGKFAAKSGPRVPKFCSPKCARRVAQRAFYGRTTRKGNPRLASSAWHKARLEAIKRDDGKCRLCGSEAKHVHHLFHRTEAEMHDHGLDNLATLCNPCHSKIHEIKVGRVDGEVVVSGLVFQLLNVKNVRVEK
jgi:5-methylcytosine-specific restriction endonuclease McrA